MLTGLTACEKEIVPDTPPQDTRGVGATPASDSITVTGEGWGEDRHIGFGFG